MLAKMLPHNEHAVDRALRIALGLALLAIALVGPKTPWGFAGLVPLVTGLVGTCPLYALFGFSTCAVKPQTQTT
ncbi:MAG TPA: DUF2892 domain-containing protein [Polyangiaceae bacterium]|nr:DUF2892 domain-containing protein [Polyangiaceae bacterium]